MKIHLRSGLWIDLDRSDRISVNSIRAPSRIQVVIYQPPDGEAVRVALDREQVATLTVKLLAEINSQQALAAFLDDDGFHRATARGDV